MDPAAPATQRFTRLLAEIWSEYLATHTAEDVAELLAEVERRKQVRRSLAIQVRPVSGAR